MMIRVCEPWFPGKEEEYVADAMKNRMISGSGGGYIEKFENAFSQYTGMKHGVACSTGLGALHLACVALGLGEEDEVIVPTFTMIASMNAIIYTGAKPVFVDSDPETYCIDVSKIEEKITSKTKAIMPVHIYGHPCDMDEITRIAKKHSLYVIEDAAEAHGAEYKGRKAGSMSDISCFSFYANKILTTGEGGMCLTNNLELAEKMKKLRNHGFDTPRFTHSMVGFNYRLPHLQAAMGLAQVENATKLVEARRNVGLLYQKHLNDFKEYLQLPVEKEYVKSVYWMYSVVLKDNVKMSKEECMNKLSEKGIETRGFFIPGHKQPVFMNKKIKNSPDCRGNYPVSEKISDRGFYLPSSSNLDEKTIEEISRTLKSIVTSA